MYGFHSQEVEAEEGMVGEGCLLEGLRILVGWLVCLARKILGRRMMCLDLSEVGDDE